MRKPSVFVAVNPAARAMSREKIDLLNVFFKNESDLKGFILSEKPGDITRIAAEVSKDSSVEILVVAGGDGTLNEAINGLSFPGPKVGYIPGGTSNVIRYELGIPSDLTRAGDIALRGKTITFRPGIANGRKFHLMAGIGIDADIVRLISKKLKIILGKGEYIRTGLKRIFQSSLPPIRVEVDGEDMGDFRWVVISRASFYAGQLKLVREASLEAELLYSYLFKRGGALDYVRYSMKTLVGSPFREKDIVRARAERFLVESTGPVPYQIDGDFMGNLPLEVSLSDDFVEIHGAP